MIRDMVQSLALLKKIKEIVRDGRRALLDKPERDEAAAFLQESAARNRGRGQVVSALLVIYSLILLVIDGGYFLREGRVFYLPLDAGLLIVSCFAFIRFGKAGEGGGRGVYLYALFLVSWASLVSIWQSSLITLFVTAFVLGALLLLSFLPLLLLLIFTLLLFYGIGAAAGTLGRFSIVQQMELMGILFWTLVVSRLMFTAALREFRYRAKIDTLTKSQRDVILARTRDLESRLEERKILMQEIHHRVKNNLQILASLSNLCVDFMDRDPPEVLMRENRNLIISMALAHECVYSSGTLQSVSLREYLSDLVDQLVEKSPGLVALPSPSLMENIRTDIDLAVGIGLIAAEVVSGFGAAGVALGQELRVGMSLKSRDERLTLTVSVLPGFPPEDFFSERSLRTLLLRAVAGQISARYTFHQGEPLLFSVEVDL